jgi:DNA-binding NarL/FixJ family response regulator
LAGGNPISHKARQILVAFFQRSPARIAAMWHLTKREFQILSSLVHQPNPSDKEIARDLNVSPGTIHAHLAHLYVKLQVHNRQEAIDKWLSNAV